MRISFTCGLIPLIVTVIAPEIVIFLAEIIAKFIIGPAIAKLRIVEIGFIMDRAGHIGRTAVHAAMETGPTQFVTVFVHNTHSYTASFGHYRRTIAVLYLQIEAKGTKQGIISQRLPYATAQGITTREGSSRLGAVGPMKVYFSCSDEQS